MDPATIAALVNMAMQVGGQFMNSQAQGNAQGIQSQALAQQQANAQQQYELATATKTDPYGNKLIFTPGVGWHYDLTEMTSGLIHAEQGEELKNLTEDAKRNRDFRARMDAMGREGGQEFDRTLNEYRYGDRPNENESVADLTREIMLARDRGSREAQNTIGRQAIRGLANPNVLQTLMRQNQEGLGSSLEEAVLRGRRLGKSEYRNDLSTWNQDIGGRLDRFGGIAKGVPQAGITRPNTAAGLDKPDISSIIQALQNASSGSTNIMQGMARTASSPGFDLGALGPSITALGKAMQPAPSAADPNSWMMTTTPNQQWAMRHDVYGNPYSWAIEAEEEEDRTIGNEFGG